MPPLRRGRLRTLPVFKASTRGAKGLARRGLRRGKGHGLAGQDAQGRTKFLQCGDDCPSHAYRHFTKSPQFGTDRSYP